MSLTDVDVRTRHAEPSAADSKVVSPRSRPALDPYLVGLLAIAISAAGASRPSSWFDEAATISAATRPLDALGLLLGHIDAVHGLYYLLMHGWFSVFPVTEFSSRAPSCLAIGVASAGVVVLTRRFGGRAVAVCAGVAFAILPRTTWAGVEARSYAFTAMAAVWLTILLVTAVRRRTWWPWVLYAVALLAAIVLNTFLALMIPVHAVAVVLLSARRSAVAGWLAASCVGAGLAAPFLLFSRSQIAQVAWLSPLGGGTVVEVVQNQYFDGSTPFAIIAGVLIVLATMVRLTGATPPRGDVARFIGMATAWLVLPTGALLLYTAFVTPVYYPRYLTFTAPAMALLLGICITEIARTPRTTAAVLLTLAVAAAPNYVLGQRGPYKKEGMDYSQVADVVTARAAAGHCLLLDNTTSWKPGPIRPLLAARPGAYRDLDDVGRGRSATATDRLWDGFVPVWTRLDRLNRCSVLWTVSERDHTLDDHDSGTALSPGPRLGGVPVYQIPRQMGFRIVERWQFSFAQVVRSTRSSTSRDVVPLLDRGAAR